MLCCLLFSLAADPEHFTPHLELEIHVLVEREQKYCAYIFSKEAIYKASLICSMRIIGLSKLIMLIDSKMESIHN